MKYIIALAITCSFLLTWDKAFGVEINTGNVLDNSTFGTGTTYTTDNWTVSSGTHGHNYMAAGNGNAPGGSVAAEEELDSIIIETDLETQEKVIINIHE